MTQRTSSNNSVPAVVVLGTDALLTARPATPVQLAHACLAAGYTAALPVSWGDELLAHALARRAAERHGEPMIACVCPRVAERLADSELDRFLVPLVPPPVATARYVRALYARDVHITYVGACPGAHDPAIDGSYSPGEFLTRLRELGIEVEDQPVVFESVLPPDRRRFDSLPGGVPTTDCLRRVGAPHALLEVQGEDYVIALAQQLLEGEPTLLDLAPRLGCDCAGSAAGSSLRLAVGAMEPPRARTPVVDHAIAVPLDVPVRPQPMRRETPPQAVAAIARPVQIPAPPPPQPPAASLPEPATEPPPAIEPTLAPLEAASLPDDTGAPRDVPGLPRLGVTVPRSRTPEGLVIPRAYLRRRRLGGETPSRHENPVADAPSELERETPIAREAEPEPEVAARAPSAPSPPDAQEPGAPRFVETEVPIRREPLPRAAATDVVPPPPIMPDPHFGDSLIVADSLSELLGMEGMAAPLAVPKAPRQAPATAPRSEAAPEAHPEAPPPFTVAPPAATEPTRPTSPARTTLVTPGNTREASAPAVASPAMPIVPPLVEPRVWTPRSLPTSEAIRTPQAVRPRASSRALTAVVLPRRRRGTAVALWLIFGSVLTLLAFGARYALSEGLPRLTRMIEARRNPAPPAEPSAPGAAAIVAPTLPPVIIDSAALAESAAVHDTANRSDTAGSSVPAESTGARQPPPRRDTVNSRPPRRAPATTSAPTRSARPPRPVQKDPPSRPVAETRPAAIDTREDTTARSDSSGQLKLDTPRVTKPWPPPE